MEMNNKYISTKDFQNFYFRNLFSYINCCSLYQNLLNENDFKFLSPLLL